jgi:hypothetical protein
MRGSPHCLCCTQMPAAEGRTMASNYPGDRLSCRIYGTGFRPGLPGRMPGPGCSLFFMPR